MTRFLLSRLLPALPLAALAGGVGLAQPGQLPPRSGQPTVPAPDAVKDDIEVLARGPIHEAYASTAELPAGGPVVEQRPPDPVEELPPDQKPDGENVQWIPGYWQFDEERKDFIWISGFWRDAPLGRVWVPGGWQEVRGGFQWVSGFWNVPAPAAQPGAAQAELEYLPPPPASLEAGPSLASPGDDYFYTPGCWVYRVNRYVWRPGFWVEHRPNWVWVPDHYRWTPCGYVFVPGYWDVPLERRGVLFAPVYFRPAVVLRPRFVYTPVYAVPAPVLHTSLFVRTGYSSYYFGDYFEQRYLTAGFNSWAVSIRGSNFAVGVSGGRGFAYDPLWSYYSVANRREPAWQRNIASVYTGRFNGTVARPPRTLVQQTTIINNITNNNTTVVNNNTTNNNRTVNSPPPATAAQVTMLAPLTELKKANPAVTLKAVQAEDRTKEQQAARELRKVAAERRRAEAQLVARGVAPTKADDKPQQLKVELPKTVVARAQQPAAKEKAPPPAPTPVTRKPDTPTAPPTGAKPGDKPNVPTVPPKNDPPKPGDPPKTGPGTPIPPTGSKPPVNPPKNDPPKPGDPPKGPPVNPPKQDPPKVDPPKGPPATPPRTDPPKVDPPKGPTIPPVGPKPGDPPKPKDPPKTDPPKGSTIPPVTPPTGPKPKDPPKQDPPKGPPVNPPTVPPIGPKPTDPPKGPPPKQDPPKTGPGNPLPPVMPPRNDPPKAPPPKVDPPKPQPPAAPPPKVDPPKPPVNPPPKPPPAAPPKADPPKADPPKSNPPKGPGAPTRPTRGDDKKDDKKGDKRK